MAHHQLEIAFASLDDQQNFLLIELPTELSSRVAAGESLHFKAPADDIPSVLCTDDSTYTVRQVNTSNSVFVVHDDGSSVLRAISQSFSTLDLTPQHTDITQIKSLITRSVPVYPSQAHRESTSKSHLFSNLPYSLSECGAAYRELCCFENEGGVYCPTPEVKVKVWKTILQNATAEGNDVASTVPALLTQVEGEWPKGLLDAVIALLTSENEQTLNLESTVLFTGTNLLSSKTVWKTDGFLDEWRDVLPEQWRGKAGVNLLKDKVKFVMVNNGGEIASVDDVGGENTPAAKETSVGKKRGWHDRFKKQKG